MTLQLLADLAGVTPRTVRYYIAQGLLPPPEGAGVAADYGDDHLRRLRRIKAMQAQYLPLAEIRARLDQAQAEPSPAPAIPAIPADPAPAEADNEQRRRAKEYVAKIMGAAVSPASPPPASPSPVALSPSTLRIARSTWERHAVGPDVEIHVQRPLSRESNRRIEQLLDYARQLFENKDHI